MTDKSLAVTDEQNTPECRIMHMSDLSRVLKIINAYDDDDGESAETD